MAKIVTQRHNNPCRCLCLSLRKAWPIDFAMLHADAHGCNSPLRPIDMKIERGSANVRLVDEHGKCKITRAIDHVRGLVQTWQKQECMHLQEHTYTLA